MDMSIPLNSINSPTQVSTHEEFLTKPQSETTSEKMNSFKPPDVFDDQKVRSIHFPLHDI